MPLRRKGSKKREIFEEKAEDRREKSEVRSEEGDATKAQRHGEEGDI